MDSIVNISEQILNSDAVYVLISEDEGGWLERSLDDLYIIKDAEDLEAAITIALNSYGYKLIKDDSYRLEPGKQGQYLVHVDFKEKRSPAETGSITFRHFPVKPAKLFPS